MVDPENSFSTNIYFKFSCARDRARVEIIRSVRACDDRQARLGFARKHTTSVFREWKHCEDVMRNQNSFNCVEKRDVPRRKTAEHMSEQMYESGMENSNMSNNWMHKSKTWEMEVLNTLTSKTKLEQYCFHWLYIGQC